MCEREYEFVDDTINSYSPANKLHRRVRRIVENKVVSIEVSQPVSPNTTCNGRDVIDIRFLNHCSHGLLHSSLSKLELGVLVPDCFEIEVWSTSQGFQKL